MEGTATGSMTEIISALNTGITSETLFGTVADLMPWVITLTIASLGFSILFVLITTLPAIESGLSNHVLKIGPP